MSLVGDTILRSQRSSIDSMLQFPAKLGAHAMLLVFKEYAYQNPGTYQLNKVTDTTYSNTIGTDSILLPLPQNIQDTFNVRVRGYELGLSGAALASGAAEMKGQLGDNRAGMGDVASVLSKVFKGVVNTDNIKNLDLKSLSQDAAFLARRSMPANTSAAYDIGTGTAINPKAALQFEGVDLKSHSFNWSFSPTEMQESDTLRAIISRIRKNVLPSYINDSSINNAILSYPNMLDIYFLGVDQSYFLYYKTCMVQQFTTDFSPNGLAFLKGGKPVSVNMSMNVIETDIHTRSDYDGSLDGDGTILSDTT